MTTHLGNNGKFKVGDDLVGELLSCSVSEEVATVDDSAIGDAWDTHLIGSKKWTMSATAMYDPGDDGQAALVVGASITVGYYPVGDGTGKKYRSGTGTVTKVGNSIQRNQRVEASIEIQGNGELAASVVPDSPPP
jgi:hypothetical protein